MIETFEVEADVGLQLKLKSKKPGMGSHPMPYTLQVCCVTFWGMSHEDAATQIQPTTYLNSLV